ncbi:hypothetical protein [Pandoraea sp. 64-18]|uniref:hypothetical protein n=1 Tax=Pandoraea sp. 64-18 TaxID=1895806 RepID=UPI000A990630|nr:hypothetical protein [Pandoraea sp. 64-18]
MARIRSVKPEFWTSEQVMDVSRDARILFIGMWNFCDDAGIHSANEKRLKAEVFPADDLTSADVRRMVDELLRVGLLDEYEVAGQRFWIVTGWHHQKIDQPTFKHPGPDGTVPSGAPKRRQTRMKSQDSTNDRGPDAERSTDDLGTFGEHSANVRGVNGECSPPERSGGEGKGEVNTSGGGIPRASGPVDKSSPPLSAEQIGEKLVALEAGKGRTLQLSSRAREALLRIASRSVTLQALLRAHDLACARRTADADTSPVNPGFLESFIGEAQAAATGTGPGEAWDTTNEGVAARAAELGIEPIRPDEPPYLFRLRVIRESGDDAMIEREVGKAARSNPADHERVHRFMYGCAPGELSTA